MDSIASQSCVTQNTVFKRKREILGWISKAVAKRNEETKFHKCAAEETFLFPRKYHRGSANRKKTICMATITGIEREGSCGRTIGKRVEKRDASTLQNLIRKYTVDSYRTIVNTDGWRGYRGLSEVREHRTVNHRKSGKYRFVTENGVHTNNAGILPFVGQACDTKARKTFYGHRKS